MSDETDKKLSLLHTVLLSHAKGLILITTEIDRLNQRLMQLELLMEANPNETEH